MLLAMLCSVLAAQLVQGYPNQVAPTACTDMTPKGPGHNNAPAQNSKVPFDFAVDKNNIKSTESVELTIAQRPGGPTFAAFMTQARAGASTTPLGTFKPKNKDAKTIKCTSDNDTGSHTSPADKELVTLIWTPPANYKGAITFYCTVAETKVKFWARQKCGTVQVK